MVLPVTVFLVAIMESVQLVMENLFVIAIPATLEQTVSTEMFALTICVNTIQHVLFTD